MEESGWHGMSLRDLADAVSIRAPSLYKHFRSKDDLKAQVVRRQFARMGDRLRAVSAPGAVAELMNAYREQAARAPEAYRLATSGPLDRDSLGDGVEQWVGGFFLDVCHGDHALAQAVWAALHGAVILELDTRFDSGTMEAPAWTHLVESPSATVDRFASTRVEP